MRIGCPATLDRHQPVAQALGGLAGTARADGEFTMPPSDFADLGTRTAVATALKRHKAAGSIRLLGRGLYDVPRVHTALGTLWPAIESGKLHLPIDKTFSLAQAAEALAHMKANAHFGKIVLIV